MTKVNYTLPNLDEDDLYSEYDFSGGIRGRDHQAYRQGYSVTIHHADDTIITEHFSPMNPEDNKVKISRNIAGDYVRGDKIVGDKVMGNKTVHNNSQDLTQAAQEIQDLIEQLSKTYPTDTRAAKNNFADEIVKQIDANSSLTNRLLSATKAGGVAAIEQFLNHPAVSFVVSALEDWEKTKQTRS